jgi:transposase-like protein
VHRADSLLRTGDGRTMDATELKRLLAKARVSKRSRYPSRLREAVIAYAGKRRAQKASREVVAAELGMSAATLSYWCAPARSRGTLEPVTIVARQEPTSEVVVECGPLRVRGLDVGSVAELLRRLA